MNDDSPIYVLECSVSPTSNMFTVDAGHDLDLLIKRAEGFVQTLYGFVTEGQVTEGHHYGYPHHPIHGGEQYAAFIHCTNGRYEEMLGMARREVKRRERV